MKHILPFLFLIVTAVTACNSHSLTYKKLEKADSLITNDKDSAALDMLISISDDELTTEEERAYHDLLLTSARYRLRLITGKDTLNKACIEYYRQAGDKEKLARALYYKGMAIYELGNVETTIRMVKEAEKLAQRTGIRAILNYIYLNLAIINNHVGNQNTALHYAKASLEMAENRDDKIITCLSLEKTGNIYDAMGKYDSAAYYTQRTLPYIKYVDKKNKVRILTNISASYFNLEQFDKAEQYIRQAIAVEPTDYCYYILGSVYLETGRTAEAEALWKKVISTARPELKAETMLWLADLKQAEGNDREAAELLTRAEAMKDSIARNKKAENTLRLQNDAERDEEQRKAKTRLYITLGTAAGMAAALAALLVYNLRRISRTRKLLEEIEEQTGRYRQKINELNNSNTENEKEINRLKSKIDKLKEKRSTIISLGQRLCEDLKDGGTVATWKKNDFEAAIEYCRTIEPEAVGRIEKSHKRLTPYNTLFLLMPVIGISDDGIPHAMNMTAGAARTMKYRLKSKRTD